LRRGVGGEKGLLIRRFVAETEGTRKNSHPPKKKKRKLKCKEKKTTSHWAKERHFRRRLNARRERGKGGMKEKPGKLSKFRGARGMEKRLFSLRGSEKGGSEKKKELPGVWGPPTWKTLLNSPKLTRKEKRKRGSGQIIEIGPGTGKSRYRK